VVGVSWCGFVSFFPPMASGLDRDLGAARQAYKDDDVEKSKIAHLAKAHADKEDAHQQYVLLSGRKNSSFLTFDFQRSW
jgi:hypothetical protein